MSEAHQSLEEILFDLAVQKPTAAERAAFLDHACRDNPTLRAAVAELLESHFGAAGFLPKPDPRVTLAVKFASPPLAEAPAQIIGRYKLLEKIGEGGFGEVWMAEQREPVKRRVALKIIKLGMDSRQIVARFEAERQALALMDHPNIARIYDAGTTDTGRPYFIMELVRGVKITEYCDQCQLPTPKRLKLFVEVCKAVQHAHQKGIIHRDIKPSNVLVTLHDGVPVPKVIDFGIAKATQGELTDLTVFTQFQQFIGTPAYVSPEQAEMSGLDIDTRADIYSLGVLLYELLVGQTPFDAREMMKGGLDALRRIIREQEPQRPSTKLNTLLGEERTTAGKRRQTDVGKLAHQIQGDLDWIVMKCLEKDRTRRYETANGLAMDLMRHLDNEPVLARPPGWFYGFQKTVRRHKLAFAAGSAVAVALLVGLASSTVLYLRERTARAESSRQEQAAKEQAAIAQAVKDFLLDDLLQQADSTSQADRQFAPNPNLTVREAVERAAAGIGDRFKDQPLVEAEIRSSIGDALKGVGKAEQAIPQQQRAWELRRDKLGPGHLDTLESMKDLASAYVGAGKFDQARALFEQALMLSKSALGPDHSLTLAAMGNLATSQRDSGNLDEALRLFEETLELTRAKLGPDEPQTLVAMGNLASAYVNAGKFDKALPLLEETLRLRRARLGLHHPDTLRAMANLGNAYGLAGKLDQALPRLEEALGLLKVHLGVDHPITLAVMNNLALNYSRESRYDAAAALAKEALQLSKARLGASHPTTLLAMNTLAVALWSAGRYHEALPWYEETLKLREVTRGPDHPATYTGMANLTYLLWAVKRHKEADALTQDLLTRIKRRGGAESMDYASALEIVIRAYTVRKQWAAAEPLLRECLGIRVKLEPDEWFTSYYPSALGRALLRQGKLVEAEPLIVETYHRLKDRIANGPGTMPEYAINPVTDDLALLAELRADQPQAAGWKAELERVRRVSDAGAIRRWLILDPIELEPGQTAAQGLDIEQLSPESQLRPRADDKVSVGGIERVWRERALRDYAIDFDELQSEYTRRSVAYAICYVKSATTQQGLVLRIGSDDQARVYLNGQKVYEQKQPRPFKLDADTVTAVALRAGLNVIVFKVVNSEDSWRGSVRFTTADGSPVTGLSVTLDPDAKQ